jgi:hypothetical protein
MLVYAIEHGGERICWGRDRYSAACSATTILNRDNPPGEKRWTVHEVLKMVVPIAYPQFRWTPPKIETMRDMMANGYSSGEVANKLGITRNMVIGKSRRLWGAYSKGRDAAMRFDNFKLMATPPWPGMLRLKEEAGSQCMIKGCRNTRQPSRLFCAEHLPKPPRTRDSVCAEISS